MVVPMSAQQSSELDSLPHKIIIPKSFIAPTTIALLSALPFCFSHLKYSVEKQPAQPLRVDEIGEYLPLSAVLAMGALGVRGEYKFIDLTLLSTVAFVGNALSVYSLKRLAKEKRPFADNRDAFPSGHAAFAFMGAELMRLQYGRHSLTYSVAAYGVALATASLRIYNGMHWAHDVLAGAAIGMLSARIAWYLYPKLKNKCLMLPAFNKKSVAITWVFYL